MAPPGRSKVIYGTLVLQKSMGIEWIKGGKKRLTARIKTYDYLLEVVSESML